MNERRKLINWMAGVTTFIVVLLIVIVLLDREEDGVSLAAASRTVALTLESGNGILENAPETSNFDEDLSDQWYVKYMDYLYGQGYLDSGSVKADERSATSAVTYAVLSDWAKKASEEGKGETDALLSYVDSGDRAKKAVSSENFWKFYDAFRAAVDPDRAVAEVETDLYGTPDNVDGAPAWTAYTRDGIFQFEGLYLDGYIDQKIRFLARDDEILKVEEMVSDEIVYENAWISGFSGKTVMVFIGNIQREFPVKGVLKDESEISGQIGDLYLKGGTPKRLVLKKEKITGTVLAVRDTEIEIDGYGSRGTLWITPVIGILCDALMLAVSFFPQTWNVGTSVTVFNRALVYRRVRDLIADTRLSTAVMFTAIAVWQTALAPTFPWGMGVLIGVCCTAPLVRFFVRLAMKK